MRTLFRYFLGIPVILFVFVLLVIIVVVLTIAVLVEHVFLWSKNRLTTSADSNTDNQF